MDYKEQIEKLKNLECIAYGYNINGEVLGMDCGDFEQIMVDAAESINDLLARAEAAEHLLQEVKEQRDYCREKCDVAEKNYQIEMERRKSAEYRARKAEQERDAAVSDLRGVAIESYAECMYCLYRTAKSFCWNCQDGSNWKWSGLKEEQEVTADKDGRCMVLPSREYSNEDGERALKNAMFVVGLTNNGVNRYIADAVAEKLTREDKLKEKRKE